MRCHLPLPPRRPLASQGVLLVTVSFEPLPHAHNSSSARPGPGGRGRASSTANTDVGSPAAYGYGFAPQQHEVRHLLVFRPCAPAQLENAQLKAPLQCRACVSSMTA